MDHSAIGLIVLAGPFVLVPAVLLCRRLYWTEWAQHLVLRWTGESRLVATAWGPSIASRKPRRPAPGAPLAGDATSGNRRQSSARALAPTSDLFPGGLGVGPTLAAATGDTPSPVAAAHHAP